MEYAYLLWIKRRTEIKRKHQVNIETDDNSMKNVSSLSKTLDQMSVLYPAYEADNLINQTSHFYKVDSISQIVSLSLFVLFNAVYWATYYA